MGQYFFSKVKYFKRCSEEILQKIILFLIRPQPVDMERKYSIANLEM